VFKQSLREKLIQIFDVPKATYDLPGESEEQKCLFIQIDRANCRVKDGLHLAEVEGKILFFTTNEITPYGYFEKKIVGADPELTKDLFFFDFEENKGEFVNVVERSLSFVYFFNGQYNPELGNITSVDFVGFEENE
jgi:hypothetical protein